MARIPREKFTACGIKFVCSGNFDPDALNEYLSDYIIGSDPWVKIMELQKLKFVETAGLVYSF